MADGARGERRELARRVAVATAVVVAVLVVVLLAARYAHLLLLLFASVLLAVLVDAVARGMVRRSRITRTWAVLLVWGVIFVLLAGLGLLAGPRIVDQTATLNQRVGEATESIGGYLEGREWGRFLLEEARRFAGRMPSGSVVVDRISGVFSTAVSWIVGAVVVVVLAVYLSVAPSVYVDNLLRLVPSSRRGRLDEVLEALGHTLRWWLAGRLSAMALLGILTTVGLAVAGVPLAFILGLLAAVTAFVPYLGPVLWLVPACLVAWAGDPVKVIWVVVVYGGVQFLEGNLITPLIQQRAVSLPPALLVAWQLFMGVLLGAVGVLVATPVAVVVIVLVQMLYVEDVLGEQVTLLGSHGSS